MSFYTFSKILSGACAAFALVVVIVHQFCHANRYSRPNEQAKYVRWASVPCMGLGLCTSIFCEADEA